MGGGAAENVHAHPAKGEEQPLGFAAKFVGRRCSLDVIGREEIPCVE